MSHLNFVSISFTNCARVCAFNVQCSFAFAFEKQKYSFFLSKFQVSNYQSVLFWKYSFIRFFFRATVNSINKFYWNRMDRRGNCILIVVYLYFDGKFTHKTLFNRKHRQQKRQHKISPNRIQQLCSIYVNIL